AGSAGSPLEPGRIFLRHGSAQGGRGASAAVPRHGRGHHQRSFGAGLLRRSRSLPDHDQPAAAPDEYDRALQCQRARRRRRRVRAGWRGAPRDRAGVDRLRRRSATGPQAREVADPRCARERAQEGWSQARAQGTAVHQAV
ncbi:MAG: SSU ribosomal protein S9p (S16e), partial [uncultured Thermomicrobiales bacterium]